MTIEQLREAHQARPFKPFTICLADGRQIPVPHPEFLWSPPGASRTFVVATSNGTFRIVDLLVVSFLDFERRPKPRRRKPRTW
jgi:hypothetical protein